MKNIFKFILRIAIAAIIVVGAVYLVMQFTGNNSNATIVADTAKNLNIVKKIQDSHIDFELIVEQNNQNDIQNKVSQNSVKAIVLVNDVLEQYLDYYINLTCFENNPDQNVKNLVIDNLNALNKKLDVSIDWLKKVNSASQSNPVEKNARIIELYNSLCNQTEVLFNTCGLLKNYVYATNFNASVCTSKKQAVLEMAKDYSKVVFDTELKSNASGANLTMITDTSTTGYLSVAQKTLNMSSETGAEVEVNFVYNYMSIHKNFVNQYFAKSNAQKSTYVLDLNNFMADAPPDETPEQLQQRTQSAQKQQKYMSYLATYLSISF